MKPDAGVTVATAVVPLVHVPPAPLLREIVEPTHTFVTPVIAAGSGCTTSIALMLQPVPRVYVITVVPGTSADTMPVEDPIVAMVVLPLLHVPPGALLNVVVNPTHTPRDPVIADGNGLIVTVIVEKQVGAVA